MKMTIISTLLTHLLAAMPPDFVKIMLDRLFDLIEDYVAETANKVDDATVLPIIAMLRSSLDIPDNDEPTD